MTLEWVFGNVALRLILAAGIALLSVALYRAFNARVLARARIRAAHSENRLIPTRPVKATLLYFTTPECAPCKTVQRPVIQRLSEQLGPNLEVIEIDAGLQPEVAGQWGVMSVPTTFILDAHGDPRHVNHGVISLEKLLRQINDLQ